MPRQKKLRKIDFIPEFRYFKPGGIPKSQLEEIQLKIEELEAMRLKDIENLSQIECAKRMEVSRQTFQIIIDNARKKITSALTMGKAINITGGTYTYFICNYKCSECGHEFKTPYEEDEVCPMCKNESLECEKKEEFCKKTCQKKCCLNNVNNKKQSIF